MWACLDFSVYHIALVVEQTCRATGDKYTAKKKSAKMLHVSAAQTKSVVAISQQTRAELELRKARQVAARGGQVQQHPRTSHKKKGKRDGCSNVFFSCNERRAASRPKTTPKSKNGTNPWRATSTDSLPSSSTPRARTPPTRSEASRQRKWPREQNPTHRHTQVGKKRHHTRHTTLHSAAARLLRKKQRNRHKTRPAARRMKQGAPPPRDSRQAALARALPAPRTQPSKTRRKT